tara:strand:+ start:773 stop:1321 length:549 start_codon:yes stop_codon:yes gene_type:complete
MAITITGNSGISMPDEGIEAKDLGNGAIIQVVSTTKQDVYSQEGDSSSWTAVTGLSASITPSNATNKILIQVQIYSSNDSNDYANVFRLYKAGSHLTGASGTGASNRDGAFLAHRQGDQGVDPYSLSNSYLDTAGGTSAITYQLYMKVEDNSNGYINRTGNDSDHWYSARCSSTITVMEVVA